jgi:multidrug efflux system membrane fusion protein
MQRVIRFCPVFILLAIGCQKQSGNGLNRQAVPVKVVAVVSQRLSEPVRTSGFLSSEAEIKLSFKTGGIIEKCFVEEGVRVRKGQLLAGLKLDEIRAMAEQAQNGFDKAKRDFQRAQNLYRDSVATLEQVQDARSGLNVAKAHADIAQFNLAHSCIAAPSDGRVLKRLAEANELIGPGYPVYIFGTDGSEWIVKVGATDRDVVRLTVGDSASVTFDAFPGQIFASTIKTVAGAPDPMSGVFQVELTVRKSPKGEKQNFINGLMADAAIFPSAKKEYRVIPFESLAELSDKHGVVYAVNPDNTARRIPVVIGFLNNDQAAVLSGLESTDRVISEGATSLSDGMPVKVIQD